jgi:hypothetical protein
MSEQVQRFRRVARARTWAVLPDKNLRIACSSYSEVLGPCDFGGSRFRLPAANASPRIITLDESTVRPEQGETITLIWIPTPTWGGGTQFTVKREDGTVIATFDGSSAPEVTTMYAWAEFEWGWPVASATGEGWRLGLSSGPRFDSTPAVYGVVPGAGA